MMPYGASRPAGLLDIDTGVGLSAVALILENSRTSTSIYILKISISPSYKESTVDALASIAEEGRGWLR